MEMTKSGVTYAAIIDAGIAIAQETGLESLTIGSVAERAGLSEWRRQLARTVRQAIDEGHLRPETDPEQVAFELCSIILGVHNDIRLFRDARAFARARAAFDRLLADLALSR